MSHSFRDLKVWQRAMQLTLGIYRLTARFPKEEQYGLTNQLRRAAVSIPSNIAEGQGRSSSREFGQFLSIARGSLCELQTQLEIAKLLEYGSVAEIKEADDLSHEVGKMIFSFQGTLQDQ